MAYIGAICNYSMGSLHDKIDGSHVKTG